MIHPYGAGGPNSNLRQKLTTISVFNLALIPPALTIKLHGLSLLFFPAVKKKEYRGKTVLTSFHKKQIYPHLIVTIVEHCF
jgi:hypothetical protein